MYVCMFACIVRARLCICMCVFFYVLCMHISMLVCMIVGLHMWLDCGVTVYLCVLYICVCFFFILCMYVCTNVCANACYVRTNVCMHECNVCHCCETRKR